MEGKRFLVEATVVNDEVVIRIPSVELRNPTHMVRFERALNEIKRREVM